MRRHWSIGLVAIAGFLITPLVALAVPTCTVSNSGISFGAISMAGLSDVTSTGTIEISCNNPNIAYTVLLSTGAGSYAQRMMTSGADSLYYNIYTSPSYTAIWGDGTGGSTAVNGITPSNANGQNNKGIQTLYGRIPLAGISAASTGSYTDAIVVTISY